MGGTTTSTPTMATDIYSPTGVANTHAMSPLGGVS